MQLSDFNDAEGQDAILAELKVLYRKFNDLFYDGRLPIIPMRWGKMKGVTAHVTFKVLGKRYGEKAIVPNTIAMVFNDRYKRDVKSLIPILLHEMIHVYIVAVLDDHKDNHGPVFMKELARMRQISQIDIPLTDTARDLEVNGELRQIGVIIRHIGDEKYYALMSEKTVREKLLDFVGKWREPVDIRVVKSRVWDRKAETIPLQRVIGYKTKFWKVNAADYQDLLDNSELLKMV